MEISKHQKLCCIVNFDTLEFLIDQDFWYNFDRNSNRNCGVSGFPMYQNYDVL